MSKRPRRNHSPVFKAKVAVDAIKGELPTASVVHSSQATPARRRGQLCTEDGGAGVRAWTRGGASVGLVRSR